jgi:D-threo-aldose 1-dehydrogenase
MAARFVRETDVDVIMIAGRYSLVDHAAAADLLPAAAERGVGVLAAGVFNSGLLARDRPDPDATFNYKPAPAELIQRATKIADICAEYETTLPAAALHFVLAHPTVVTAVLGMSTPDHVGRNLGLLAVPPADDLWEALRQQGLLPDSAVTPDRLG